MIFPIARMARRIAAAACIATACGATGPAQADEAQTAAVGAAAAFAGTPVGTVDKLTGNAAALFDSTPRTLRRDDEVKFRDTLLTGANTRVHVTLIDDSVLFLGDDTQLTIDEMVYEPGVRGSGVLTVFEGVFRMVSGHINTVAGGSLTINTPVATVGIRGTDFWGRQTADTLTMAVIDDGVVEITGADGRTVILDSPLETVVIERGRPTPDEPFDLPPEDLAAAAETVAFPD
jgi:hypothetical protein